MRTVVRVVADLFFAVVAVLAIAASAAPKDSVLALVLDEDSAAHGVGLAQMEPVGRLRIA